MRRLSGTSCCYAKPFLALAMASGVMFAMAASSDAREATAGSSESRQRAASEGSIVVAGKLSSALKGAAAGSRVGRSRSSDSADEPKDHADEDASEHARPIEEADGNGPFKVIIPGHSPEEVTIQRAAPRVPVQPRQEMVQPDKPAGVAQPQQSETPAKRLSEPAGSARPLTETRQTAPERTDPVPGSKPASPVRTIFETPSEQSPREATAPQGDEAPADVAAPNAPATQPAPSASLDVAAPAAPAGPAGPTECMAGCYETTSARTQHPPSVRSTAAKAQPAAAQPAPAKAGRTARPSLECVAGCDGIDTGKAPAMKRGAAPAPATDETTARVTILRGISKSKSYNVGQ